MGTFIESYRGYEIWFWFAGEQAPSEVWTAENGVCPITGLWKTKQSAKNQIDKKLDTPWSLSETYRGVDIYFKPSHEAYSQCNVYRAIVEAQTKYFPNYDLAGCKAWIDEELGEAPPRLPLMLLLALIGLAGLVWYSQKR